MGGTREGAAKARAKVLAANPNHFSEIGKLGGKAPHVSCGFEIIDKEKLSAAGRKGGSTSRKRKQVA